MENARQRETGNALIVVLAFVLVLGGLSTSLLLRSVGGQHASTSELMESRLLIVAEAGLNYNFLQMEADPLYAVKAPANFTEDSTSGEYRSKSMTFGSESAPVQARFEYAIQYIDGSKPIVFEDREEPTEAYDRIRVVCSARSGSSERQVAAWYAYELSPAFGGAIVSDMLPRSVSNHAASKKQAIAGNIAFDGKGRSDQHVVFGDIRANGNVTFHAGGSGSVTMSPLNNTDSSDQMLAHVGEVAANLGGTADEIPDFTSLGGDDQLFDFARFEAAARAGAGQAFDNLDAFITAMRTSNRLHRPIEGITIVHVDPAIEGAKPRIEAKESSAGDATVHTLRGGINIAGTLVFKFADGTDPGYKIYIETALNINAADLRRLDPTDEATYASGYPAAYRDLTKQPNSANIAPNFENFQPGDDLPALMFNNAVVDIHGPANVSGVVYGPSFIEIENKRNSVQYFNGAIFGGGGVYLEGSGEAAGLIAIRFDANAVDKLATRGGMGQSLVRTGFAILK